MKVDGSLKSNIQGVSQQPARTRLPGQCTLQDNASSNPVDGLTRRPPTEFVAELFAGISPTEYVQFFNYSRDAQTKFILACTQSSVRAFDLLGNEYPVQEYGDALDYIDGGKLCATTLDKDVYFANTTVPVKMKTDLPAYVDTGYVVFSLGGQYGRVYSLTLNWKESGSPSSATVSFTTPNGGTTTDITAISTTNIITQLNTALNANATTNSRFETFLVSDVVYIRVKASATTVDPAFNVSTTDGANGTYLFAVGRTVTDTAKLPRFAPQGFVVKITGTGQSSTDDWYVKYTIPAGENGITYALGTGFGVKGRWVECSAPGLRYLMNTATMPHILSYNATTHEFSFYEATWKGRQVGDEQSNEDPSFIDKPITDIGSFQGRLAVLSGDAIIMSRTDKPLDFWIKSATAYNDADPIDVSSTANGVGDMLRMLPYNKDLLVFASGGQFTLSGRTNLTPKNASLVLSTSFEANLDAPPVAGGRNIFFATNYGEFTGIREYFTDGSTGDINDSRVITQHVSKYIKGHVANLTTSSNFDILFVQTKTDNNYFYVYEYIWQDDKKAQSSWSRWTLPNEVIHSFMVESVVYYVSRKSGMYMLEKADMNIQPDTGLTYNVRLDRKKTINNVHYTITNPYTYPPAWNNVVFVQGEGCPNPGLRVEVDSIVGNTITLRTDMLGGKIIMGQRYRTAYRPTMPFVKDSDGIKIDGGKLTVKQFLISLRESAEVYASVISQYREPTNVYYSGRIVGDPGNLIGIQTIQDGVFIVPYRDNTNYAEMEIYTDSHLPMSIMDISWNGQYNKSGQRIAGGS